MRLWPWDTRTYTAAFVVQGTQPLTEDLYRQEGKQNPGEPGYGAKPTSASMGTSAGRNRPPCHCSRSSKRAGDLLHDERALAGGLLRVNSTVSSNISEEMLIMNFAWTINRVMHPGCSKSRQMAAEPR